MYPDIAAETIIEPSRTNRPVSDFATLVEIPRLCIIGSRIGATTNILINAIAYIKTILIALARASRSRTLKSTSQDNRLHWHRCLQYQTATCFVSLWLKIFTIPAVFTTESSLTTESSDRGGVTTAAGLTPCRSLAATTLLPFFWLRWLMRERPPVVQVWAFAVD